MERVELRLIAKIVKTGRFRDVLHARIDERTFLTAEGRALFRAIREYYKTPAHYGRVPTAEFLSNKFNFYSHPKGNKGKESIAELCEMLRQAAMRREIDELIEEVGESVDTESPYKLTEMLRSRVAKISQMTPRSRDILMAESADDLITEYEQVRDAAGGVLGIPWPWDSLNRQTQGIQEEDFTLIYGRMKSMKSWIGLAAAVHAYTFGNRRVLYYSAEMPPEQIRKRAASIICELDFDKVRRGLLDDEEEAYYFRELRNLKKYELQDADDMDHRSLMFTSDKDDPSGGGVSHVVAKAEIFRPDLIVVDAFYRMKDDRTGKRGMRWDIQAAIIQDLKHATQSLHTPIIGITQQNRSRLSRDEDDQDAYMSEEGMEDVSFSDAAGQEADVGFRVIKKGPTSEGVELLVYVAGAREFQADGFKLYVTPGHSFKWGGWLKRKVRQRSTEAVTSDNSGKVGRRGKKGKAEAEEGQSFGGKGNKKGKKGKRSSTASRALRVERDLKKWKARHD